MLEKQRQLADIKAMSVGSDSLDRELGGDQGGWKVTSTHSDFTYDGSSRMNEEEASTATDPSAHLTRDSSSDSSYAESQLALDSARSRFSSSLLASLLCSLTRRSSSTYSQLEEPAPVRYESTTSGTLTSFGPFVFYSSFSSSLPSTTSSQSSSVSTTYYTGEYIDEEEEDVEEEQYVESDESIAYYFQGIYDSSYDDSSSDSSQSDRSSSIFGQLYNWQLISLSLLLVGAAFAVATALRSYMDLRAAMRHCLTTRGSAGGQLMYPVVVERNGRRVRGYVVLPDEGEDEGEDLESQGEGKKGEDLFVSPTKAQAQVEPVVIAKDLI